MQLLTRRILESQAALDHKRARIAEKVQQGVKVEPGQLFLTGTTVEVRA